MKEPALFDSDICSDCEGLQNLPFHDVSFRIGNSGATESSF